MNTPQHTPGPWRHVENGALLFDSERQDIAFTYPRKRKGEQAANFRLIAAAPAMYRELKESLILLRASYHDMCEKHGADSMHAQIIFERIESVQAALAQAEGKG